ncbi:MAG: peptidyl-prolyl cis-trans isomerase [Thermodesulfobacteriota bacterium]
MTKKISKLALVCALVLVTCGAAGSSGDAKSAVDPVAPAPAEEVKELTISLRQPSSTKVEEVPLFSEKYSQTPVAMVNGEPTTLEEFADQLVAMHSDMEQPGTQEKKNYLTLLNRIIGIKLVVQEAVNIGLDQTSESQKQMEDFALKTLIKQLVGRQLQNMKADPQKVEELYKQMALEAKLTSYKFASQADAQALLDQHKAGGDFSKLAQAMVKSGKAEGGEKTEEYIKLKDLLPSVAQAVFAMKIGGVSEIFQTDKGFQLFKLEDRRPYDDPEARSQATQMVLQQQVGEKQAKYLKELEDKYATMNKEAEQSLDFEKIMQEKPGAKAAEVFAPLRNDQRPLATIKNNGGTTIITVAEIVKELEATFYHGTDQPIAPKETNAKKDAIIQNKLLKIIGPLEAKIQGIDQSKQYLNALKGFREKMLFDAFISKAVLPGVKVSQAEARAYYNENIGEYTTPLMLKLKSLAFSDEKNAQDALKKLKAGSDFKWVSANVAGLVAEDDPRMLNFGGNLLAVTALPADLQKTVDQARPGDTYLYKDPGNLFYVLVVESAFAPQAKSYDEVQNEAAKIVYGRKIKEALDEYERKLKEVYETEIFIVNGNN